MSHTQFTHTERIALATLLRAGMINADCARELGKDRSAIGREIMLNKDDDGIYSRGSCTGTRHGAQEGRKACFAEDRE